MLVPPLLTRHPEERSESEILASCYLPLTPNPSTLYPTPYPLSPFLYLPSYFLQLTLP